MAFSPGEQSIVLLRGKRFTLFDLQTGNSQGGGEIICESKLYLGEFYLGLKLVDLVGEIISK